MPWGMTWVVARVEAWVEGWEVAREEVSVVEAVMRQKRARMQRRAVRSSRR